jgi:hypothetical protein
VSLNKIFAISLVLLLAGCATAPTVISDYCQNYRIIRPSRSDTPDTLKQVATENAKYRAVCPARK